MPDKHRLPPVGVDTAEAIAARIEHALNEKGMSARALSLKIGRGQTYVRDIGRRGSQPSARELAKIASILGTSSGWLLNGIDSGVAEPSQVEYKTGTTGSSPATPKEWQVTRVVGPSKVSVEDHLAAIAEQVEAINTAQGRSLRVADIVREAARILDDARAVASNDDELAIAIRLALLQAARKK